MKICAVTMVYRDYWALSQWHRHYAKWLGAENLFIVAHGADDRITEICPGSSIINIPRENLNGFDRIRGRMLNGLQQGLGQIYHRVIRTDVDELISLDPSRFDGFADLFEQLGAEAVFALGFDVVEREGDVALVGDDAVFSKRSGIIFNGHYSKAFAVSDDTPLVLHGIRVPKRKLETYQYQMPRGVYLAHLKFANLDALASSNAHRTEVATRQGRGLPGKAWAKADKTADKMFQRMSDFPTVSWDEAEQTAYNACKMPVRNTENQVIRAPFTNFREQTALPDWFKNI